MNTHLPECVVEASTEDICELLQVLAAAIDAATGTPAERKLLGILKAACSLSKERWDSSETVLTADQLETYADATVRLTPIPPMPALDASWRAVEKRLLEEQNSEYELDADNIEQWSRFIDAVADAEPRLLAAKGFPDQYVEQIDVLFERITDEADGRPDLESPAEMRAEAARLTSLADTVTRLRQRGVEVDRAIDLVNRLRTKAEALEDRANQEDEPEPDPDGEDHGGRTFDIQALFKDL